MVRNKKYSDGLKIFSGTIDNVPLLTSLEYIKKYKPNYFEWDDENIAISLRLHIDLPPLGNFQGIDIRSIEPVLIVVNLKEYPRREPRIYPDRVGFPRNGLAHLYIPVGDKPPQFCIAREGLKEWYANKRMNDLLTRVENWLRDAASGELATNGDEFDPLRLESYNGVFVYDYNILSSLVTNNKSFSKGGDFAIVLFESPDDNSNVFTLSDTVTPETLPGFLQAVQEEQQKNGNGTNKKTFRFAYLVWSRDNEVSASYDVEFPKDFETLRSFALKFGIDFMQVEKFIANSDPNYKVLFPIVVAIKRPKKIIGYDTNIELLNFKVQINTTDVADDRVINNTPVSYGRHNQPLTSKLAQTLSGWTENQSHLNLIFGCGALGSKVIIHLSRGGMVNNLLFDPDTLSSHNLIRHSLFSDKVGLNKATALREVIKSMYKYEDPITIGIPALETEIFNSELAKLSTWILDFSASKSFFDYLSIQPQLLTQSIASGHLSYGGKLGILLFEGSERNPRIDDLKILLYSQYKEHVLVQQWLQREAISESGSIEVNTGMGCSSATFVISDEQISIHSALFSTYLRKAVKSKKNEGKIYLSYFDTDSGALEVRGFDFIVPKLDVIQAANDATWTLRIKDGLLDDLKREMGSAMPHETGGVLIGTANYKTKTIHIVDIVPAPADSKANHVCFFRGIEGLPGNIEQINNLSGNQLGYIGEWHSHPFGPNAMSQTDAKTVKKFKTDFEALLNPLPVVLIIVTPTNTIAYVY